MKNIVIGLVFLASVLAANSQSWTNRYSGVGIEATFGTAIAVDSSGNAVVTGVADGNPLTIKYSAAGVPMWTNQFGGWLHSLAVDDASNVFVVNGDGLIKCSSSGVPLWTNRCEGPANEPVHFVEHAVDKQGNAIVIGNYSIGNSSSTRGITVKYSPAGVPLWTNVLTGSEPFSSGAELLTLDKDGNVFVAGGIALNPFDPILRADYTTIVKYSSTGVPLATANLARSISFQRLACDSQGSLLAAGWINSTGDAVTAKYSADGIPLWINSFNGSASGEDVAQGVAVDSQDNVIIAGYSWAGPEANDFQYLTLKYSPTGTPLWTNYFRGEPDDNFVEALALDSHDNVFITGLYAGATVAYSATGAPLWTNRFSTLRPKAIAADFQGNVFVTGQSGYDWVTIKFAVGVAPPFLSIQRLGNNAVLSWTESTFGLQSAPTITGTFTNVPGATSPYTNAISGGQRFYRLAQ